MLRVKYPEVPWWKLVWFSSVIPKHSFLLVGWFFGMPFLLKRRWLAGDLGDANCLFCHGGMQNREHLFFSWSFSRRIWRVLMAACHFEDPPLFWEDVEIWSVKMLQGKNLEACLCRLWLGAVIYHLWRNRNDLQHGNAPKSEEAIVANIKWEVRSKVLTTGKFENLSKHLDLVYRWNLHLLL